jgi:hypothetical protein
LRETQQSRAAMPILIDTNASIVLIGTTGTLIPGGIFT